MPRGGEYRLEQSARWLIAVGLAIVGLGVVLYLYPSIPWLGKLPGDLRIERPGFRLYFPITSCLLASALVSALVWMISRWR